MPVNELLMFFHFFTTHNYYLIVPHGNVSLIGRNDKKNFASKRKIRAKFACPDVVMPTGPRLEATNWC